MRVLLVKTKNIGDALLLTAAARAIRRDYPEAKITALVRAGTEGILAGAVSIDHVATWGRVPEASASRSRMTWWKHSYDLAIDLGGTSSGRWAVLLSRAGRRSTRGPARRWPSWCARSWVPHPDIVHHAARDFYHVSSLLPLHDPVPALEFARERADYSAPAPFARYAVLHPSTRWSEKRWPLEQWIILARHFQETHGLPLVLSSGPSDEEVAFTRSLHAALDPARTHCTEGKLTWSQLAGLLFRARLFAGVDTAAMHLAAACQCPTLALMVYDPRHWGPWHCPHRTVHAPPDHTLTRAQRMQRLDAASALAAADTLLASSA